jgi:hypothetical protein
MSDIKDPEEIVDPSFDFTKDLGAEQIQAGTPVVTIAVVSGVDAGAAAMLQGAPTIVGNIVFQRLRDGLDKVDYKLRCKVTTSGGRKLVLALPVRVRTI